MILLRATRNSQAPYLLKRFSEPVCVHQFVEDFLKYVFSIAIAPNSRTDKLPKARLFSPDYVRQPPILLSRNSVGSQDSLHLTM